MIGQNIKINNMIRLGGLVSQKAFGKFEMGKVISNPFANAFVNEAEGEDHEVSMANNSLDTIIKMATELKAKMGENEKDIPAWIQDHITNAENYISQASSNYHEYGNSNESVNEDSKFDLQLVKNMQQTIKDLETKLKVAKDSREKEMIKKNIAVNADLMKYWAQRSRMGESVVKEASPCWKGYKQVGMKDKDGKQVPNCVPNESVVKESLINEWKLQLDLRNVNPSEFENWADSSLQKKHKIKISGSGKNWIIVGKGNDDRMGSSADWITQLLGKAWTNNKIKVVQKESVNEAPNTGEKIQNLNNRIKALKDKMAATKSSEQKNLIQQRLKNALQTLSNYKKQNISKEGVVKEVSGRVPQIFLKTGAVEKKIKELMADRKKAVVPYNSEKDPKKKEILKQILIKLTKQIQGYEKNLVQLRDKEEEYIQQMQADAELDTSAFD